MPEVFEPALLPDVEKRELCEKLLSEFGVTRWRATDRGEMIHSCPIPGMHTHGDRNPSASLNYKKLTFNCLGCGSRGGLLYFISRCRGQDADGVRDWLSGATGTGGHVMDLGRLLEILDALEAPSSPPPPMPRFSLATLDPWTRWGQHPYMTETEEIAPGLRGRGCPVETLNRFRIGYAPEYAVGSDQTQERIIIPLFWRGDLVGWQARRLAPWDEPKYRNSVSFPRDRVLFNYPLTREALVVESPLSVLRHVHHQPDMVSTLGAQVTDIQTRLLHRYRRVILWFDNDDAGWLATTRAGLALEAFCDVWVVETDLDVDPADLGDSQVQILRDQAVPFSLWERPQTLVDR